MCVCVKPKIETRLVKTFFEGRAGWVWLYLWRKPETKNWNSIDENLFEGQAGNEESLAHLVRPRPPEGREEKVFTMILHFQSDTLQTFNRCRRGPSKPSTWTLPLFCHPAHSILSRPPGCNGGEYCKFIERKRNLRKSLTILFCLMSLTRWSACWLTKHQFLFTLLFMTL